MAPVCFVRMLGFAALACALGVAACSPIDLRNHRYFGFDLRGGAMPTEAELLAKGHKLYEQRPGFLKSQVEDPKHPRMWVTAKFYYSEEPGQPRKLVALWVNDHVLLKTVKGRDRAIVERLGILRQDSKVANLFWDHLCGEYAWPVYLPQGLKGVGDAMGRLRTSGELRAQWEVAWKAGQRDVLQQDLTSIRCFDDPGAGAKEFVRQTDAADATARTARAVLAKAEARTRMERERVERWYQRHLAATAAPPDKRQFVVLHEVPAGLWEKASMSGRYGELIRAIRCTKFLYPVLDHADGGATKERDYCWEPRAGKAGFWVYAKPYLFIWAKQLKADAAPPVDDDYYLKIRQGTCVESCSRSRRCSEYGSSASGCYDVCRSSCGIR